MYKMISISNEEFTIQREEQTQMQTPHHTQAPSASEHLLSD